jgi:hypothetical protein
MSNDLNRREFLKIGAVAGTGVALGALGSPQKTSAQSDKPIKIGFVGIGGQGSSHLDTALGIEGVEVPAICDIKPANLYRAKSWVEESGRPTPRLYGKDRTDFKRMMDNEELDLVVCTTSWEWHAPVLLAAMNTGKNAVSEVPVVIKLDEAWELVETFEKTGKWGTLISKGGPSNFDYAIHQGLLGDIVSWESGYVHDLRLVKNDPEREPWRLQHSLTRNGCLYPDHPTAGMMPACDINHGDRFDYLVSMSSKSVMLNRFADLNYGPDNPLAKAKVALGDVNVTLLHSVNGLVYTLNHDTNTPHPRELTRVQGTKGVYMRGSGTGISARRAETAPAAAAQAGRQPGQAAQAAGRGGGGGFGGGGLIYLDGITPTTGEPVWEDAGPHLREYQLPVIANYKPVPRKEAVRGHSAGGKFTPMSWYRLVTAVREGKVTDFDVYDSVTSSSIGPLSEMSVAGGSKPIEFPDFTKGKWKSRPRMTWT